MKKFLSFLLLSAILCSFAACGGNQPTQTTPAAEGTTAAPSSSESTTVPEETPVFPENASYDGHDFLILVAGNYKSNDFASDENNADIIGSAIYRRNMIINEKFDVNIENEDIIRFNSAGGSGDGFMKMRQSYTANSYDYDMCMIGSYDAANVAKNAMASDLNNFEVINLSASWWDQRANSDLKIKDKVFYTTGDISITDNRVTHCILFNKGIVAESSDLLNPYQLVRDGKWTFDTLAEEVRKVGVDVDANDVMDEKDKYGLLTWNDSFSASVAAVGNRFARVNEEGTLELTFYNETLETLAEKYCDLTFDSQHAFNYQYQIGSANWDPFRNSMFRESRALYYMQTLTAVSTFRDDAVDFGILPYPKLDEKQTEYNNLVSVFHAHFVMVPCFVENEERTGTIVEALAYYGQKELTPAYFEKTLVGSQFRDEESGEMLNVIFNSRVYDVGLYYNVGNLKQILLNIIASHQNKLSSSYTVFQKKAEADIENINSALANIK